MDESMDRRKVILRGPTMQIANISSMKQLNVEVNKPANDSQTCNFQVLYMEYIKKVGPPCAQWCTTQVGGAQDRLMVHNIVLHHSSGA